MSPDLTKHLQRLTSALLLCLLASCAQKPVEPPVAIPTSTPAPAPAPIPAPASAVHQPVDWSAVSGWSEDDPAAAWPALRLSCGALQRRPQWQPVCEAARALGDQPGRTKARAFFEQHFQPWRLANPDGAEEGLVTGYYEPLIQGSLSRSGRYAWPIHGVPKDMLTIELGDVYPELKSLRLRGRVVGNKVVPYWSRAELEQMQDRLPAPTLMWAADPIDLFFLQVQGSGRVQLPDGRLVRIGYADQNGHPYQSIGRWLVAQGELRLDQASMQGIRQWAENNPQRLHELLNANPSYVFFRQLPSSDGGPVGALGVPLSAGRSIAVDPRFVPLGAPVFLATSAPQSNRPLNRLMLAQDTGGAIKGAVRADFFWGFGHDAGQLAGRMKQPGRMWLMLPKGMTPPAPPTKS